MATTPSEIALTNITYTRVVNNSTTYLVQNTGSGLVYIAASSTDLGATTATDLKGYKISSGDGITNEQLKSYPYVYAISSNDTGSVRV